MFGKTGRTVTIRPTLAIRNCEPLECRIESPRGVRIATDHDREYSSNLRRKDFFDYAPTSAGAVALRSAARAAEEAAVEAAFSVVAGSGCDSAFAAYQILAAGFNPR